MSDFFMYLARLEQNPHEYSALNAITRLIAERVGYTVKPRFMQAPTQWQLVTPEGGQIVFKSKGTDIDAAWQTARTKKLLPEYALSVDAALTLPLPKGGMLVIHRDCENGEYKDWTVTLDGDFKRRVRSSKHLAHAIVATWWMATTGETPAE